MARPKKVEHLSAAEIKAKKADLKTALKNIDIALKPFTDAYKAVEKTHAAMHKAHRAECAKALKEEKAAASKRGKAVSAADKGREKINAQLAALEPVASEPAAAA